MKHLCIVLPLLFIACKSRQFQKPENTSASNSANGQAGHPPCAVFVKGQAMVNAENGECKTANNKCEVDSFAASGHILSNKECVNENCAMFFMPQAMFNPESKACAKAGNGCAVANLEGVGYRLAQQEECVKSFNN